MQFPIPYRNRATFLNSKNREAQVYAGLTKIQGEGSNMKLFGDWSDIRIIFFYKLIKNPWGGDRPPRGPVGEGAPAEGPRGGGEGGGAPAEGPGGSPNRLCKAPTDSTKLRLTIQSPGKLYKAPGRL